MKSKRNLTAEDHRKHFGKRRCWICGKKLKGRRRHYCSDECYAKMGRLVESTTWSVVREKALKRDSSRCVICKNDYNGTLKRKAEIEKRLDEIHEIVMKKAQNGCINFYDSPEEKERIKLDSELNYLELQSIVVDHILPIAMGGHPFDLKNLQTLCLKCNKKKTIYDIKTLKLYRKCKTDEQRREIADAHIRTLKSVGLIR